MQGHWLRKQSPCIPLFLRAPGEGAEVWCGRTRLLGGIDGCTTSGVRCVEALDERPGTCVYVDVVAAEPGVVQEGGWVDAHEVDPSGELPRPDCLPRAVIPTQFTNLRDCGIGVQFRSACRGVQSGV